MSILLDNFSLPQKGVVTLNVKRSFTINITADEAQQQIHQWLLDHVSCNVGAGKPDLAIGQNAVVWRVPAILTAPHLGEVGAASYVDLDVQTGEMLDLKACRERILEASIELFKKMPAYVRRTEMAGEYLTPELHYTHTKPIGDLATIINSFE